MKTEALKIIELEEAKIKALNDRDLEHLMNFFHPEVVGFSSTRHERIAGLQAIRINLCKQKASRRPGPRRR